MDWTAIGTGIAIISFMYTLLRNMKSEIMSVKSELKKEIEEIKTDIKSIKTDVHSIDQRLSRLEGSFVERGNWESRIYVESKNIRNQHAQAHQSKKDRRRGH